MKIVIVGGGTAGWITSFMFAKTRPQNEYINISSSSIGSIGVGEGTTGLFRRLFTDDFYELDEWEFIKKTKAVPKMGINFVNWTPNKSSFISPLEGSTTSGNFLDTDLYGCILNNYPIEYSAKSSFLALENKTNFMLNNNQVELYEDGMHGYHLDTHLTAEFFKEKSIENKVKYIDAIITNVSISDGLITSIILDNGMEVTGDLFVDCSGFERILTKSLNQKFNCHDKFLHVNSALIFSLEKEKKIFPSTTQAIAMNNGWIFEIPKQYGIGRGYIHNDNFATTDNLIEELELLYKTKVIPKKTLNYNCGSLNEFFFSNCLSIGLSSCFVEPLQATSIHCSIVQITDFLRNCLSDNLEKTMHSSVMKFYNERTKKLYSDVVDFVSMHYSGGREDTKFWQTIKYEKEKTETVKTILELANIRLSRWDDWQTYYGCMNQILWSSSLAGLGHYKKEIIKKVLKNWNYPIEYIKISVDTHISHMNQIKNKCLTTNQFINLFE